MGCDKRGRQRKKGGDQARPNSVPLRFMLPLDEDDKIDVSDVVLRRTRETRLRFDARPASSRALANAIESSLASSLTRIAGSSSASLATVLTRFGIRTTLSRRSESESKTVFVIRRRLRRTTALPPRERRSMMRLKKADWTARRDATAVEVRRI